MNEEKYVLAELKRVLARGTTVPKDSDHIFYWCEACQKVLALIASYEADAVLGTPELTEAFVDKLFEKEDK